MSAPSQSPVRVLHSFPHRLGVGRICSIAWEQMRGASAAGAEILAAPASVGRPLPAEIPVAPTLARGRFRVPFRVVGQHRALELHDRIVARRLPKLAGRIDLVHTWPLGALQTLRVARSLGIPTVLERPNMHTRQAFEIVRAECERLGVALPPDHEHAYNEHVIEKEEREYALADRLLCPSDFVLESFSDENVPPEKLTRHIYGFDPERFSPGRHERNAEDGLTVLFAGVAAVRKGLHFALEAWLDSPASIGGTFLVAGSILPAYRSVLKPMLSHPSVLVLGHRSDLPDLMRESDMLLLPSLEEGSALVCSEAIGCGCVPLVSNRTSGVCRHEVNSLVHPAGDTQALKRDITRVHEDRALLGRLRANALAGSEEITWQAAGRRLAEIYAEAAATAGRSTAAATSPPVGSAAL